MVRVTSKANGALTGHEELGQLRMTSMKLHLIGGNFLEQINRFFIVVVFSFGKSDQHLVIARLAHDVVFPSRVRELLIGFWLLAFLDQIRVPSRNIELCIRSDPKV